MYVACLHAIYVGSLIICVLQEYSVSWQQPSRPDRECHWQWTRSCLGYHTQQELYGPRSIWFKKPELISLDDVIVMYSDSNFNLKDIYEYGTWETTLSTTYIAMSDAARMQK